MDSSIWLLIGVLALFVVFMVVMPMFTKKRQGSVPELFANLSIGDRVMTIGGIIGKVVEIKEKTPVDKEILIETGAEGSKSTVWLDIKGIYQNLTKPPVPTNFFGRPKATAAAPAPVETPVQPLTEESAKNEEVPDISADPFLEETAAEVAELTVESQVKTVTEEKNSELTAPAAKTGSAAKTKKTTTTKK